MPQEIPTLEWKLLTQLPTKRLVLRTQAVTVILLFSLVSTAGGITAQIADEKNLTLGNAAGDTYFRVEASNTAANEKISVKNTSGDSDFAISLVSTAGGITAQVADEKNLTLGNADGDAYFRVEAFCYSCQRKGLVL